MAIRLKNITYKKVLDDINLELEDGRVYAIFSNDTDEKTALGMLLEGNLEYEGKIVSTTPSNRIKFIRSEPKSIFMYNKVGKELEEALIEKNYREDTINKKVNDTLKMINLDEEVKNLNPNDLSSGEQKLLSIGISLTKNPKVLILDEPVLDLDDYNRKKIIRLLKKIAKRYNKIIIVLTKDVLLANDVCDMFVLLNKGKVVLKGKKKELLEVNDKICLLMKKEPKITDFIDLAYKKKNVSLDMTYDIKELMKDIYRNAK